MNTIKYFLEATNKELSSLVGLRVKKSDEYHTAKRNIINKHLPQGLEYSTWGIRIKGTYEDIFSINFSIDKDGRVKNNMAGTILTTDLAPVHKSIDTGMPIEKYVASIHKINLMKIIEQQKITIETKKKELFERITHLDELEKELEQLTNTL